MLLLLCVCPCASADLGIVDALSDIVKGGIDKFLISWADNLYELSYTPNGTEVFNGTATEIFIYAATTSTVDPWSHQGVIDLIQMTWLMVVLYASIYAVVGLCYLAVHTLYPAAADVLDGMLNRSSAFRMIRIKEYFVNLVTALGVLGFTMTFMQMLFTLSFFLTSFFIVSCFAVKSLAPSTDNVILYLAISMFYATLSMFMSARGLLLIIFVGAGFVIGALLISNKTRDIGLSIGYYFVGVLFLQPIIVLLTTLGFIGVDVLCADAGIVAGSVGEITIYFILLIILVCVCLRLIFGIHNYRKRAVQTMRLVI